MTTSASGLISPEYTRWLSSRLDLFFRFWKRERILALYASVVSGPRALKAACSTSRAMAKISSVTVFTCQHG